MYRRISGVRPRVGPGNMNGAPGYAAPSFANGPNGYATPMNPAMNPGYTTPPSAGGMGGGLGGALMTGAAMGLGAMAVEQAVRHFSHENDRPGNTPDQRGSSNNQSAWGDSLGPDVNADMGGNDFGISDTGSWDSGGGGDGGGSDW